MNRNSWAAVAATVTVVVVVVLGFRMLGSPASQRLVQSDLRAVQALANLAQQIQFRWQNSQKALPARLDTIPATAKQNPITHEAFVYRPKSASAYELCATFVTDTRGGEAADASNRWDPARWAHPKGSYCFSLDASEPVPQAPYVY
jgi:hypothetical protein